MPQQLQGLSDGPTGYTRASHRNPGTTPGTTSDPLCLSGKVYEKGQSASQENFIPSRKANLGMELCRVIGQITGAERVQENRSTAEAFETLWTALFPLLTRSGKSAPPPCRYFPVVASRYGPDMGL